MTPDLLKWAASLGVGGILAAGMFWIYRKDALAAQDSARRRSSGTRSSWPAGCSMPSRPCRGTPPYLECLARKDDGQTPPPQA